MLNEPSNDNEPLPVVLITGRVRRSPDGPASGVQILLAAPDDDSAVHRALEALRSQGFVQAELDQIGEVDEVPDEEPLASAYQGALEGEVSVVTLKAGSATLDY